LNLMWSDLVQFFVLNDKIKYFVIFLCDFIKRSVIYVLRVKSNTFNAFKHFQQHNEHEDNRVRRLRTNWKKEYFNDEFDKHRFEHDIKWKSIVSKTSKQNKVVERLKQILMSMINIMLKDVDLNDKWWIELIKTINYLRNRSSMTNKSIIFFEVRHETKIFFRSSLSNWDNELCHETQINHEMKKACLQIVFCSVCKLRKESHLSNVTSQWDHLLCLVCYLNQEKARRIISFHFWNIDKTIDHRFNHILSEKTNSEAFDEKTSSEIEFDNHSHVFVSAQSINYCRLILFDSLNRESQHIKHRVNFVHILDIQRFRSSFRITLSFRLFWLIKFVDYEMHEKRHRFSANLETSIIQEDHERFKSRRMNKNHEERKQLFSDQRNLNTDQFF
jgi:hypothetical protein